MCMVDADGLMHDSESPTTSHPGAPLSHSHGSRLLDPPPLGLLLDSTMTLIFLLVCMTAEGLYTGVSLHPPHS